MIHKDSKITVIAPHPDDETIAMGGTLAKFSELGCKISILIISGHLPPLYPQSVFEETVKEAKRAFSVLGINNYEFASIPATFVHEKPISELNSLISDFIKNKTLMSFFYPSQIDILIIG